MRKRIFDYDQQILVNLKLNMNEVLIINYLEIFFSSGCAVCKNTNGEKYFWVTYKKILGDLPVLNMKQRQLQNVIAGLIKKGILKKNNDGKRKVYFSLNLNLLYDMAVL